MKQILVIAILISICEALWAQQPKEAQYNISFVKMENGRDTIYRTEQMATRAIKITVADADKEEFKDHSIEIIADEESTLKSSYYEIKEPVTGKIKDLGDSKLFFVYLKDEEKYFKQTEPLKLVLKIVVKKQDNGKEVVDEKGNSGKIQKIVIMIFPGIEKLPNYRYLGYLGTNFDLVDGIHAKNLFFATNIFIPDTKRWGFALSLYGNRTMTKTDSTRLATYESRIEKINEDSIARYFDSATRVSTRVSDNIGINFTPLYEIKPLSEATLKLFYAPQFEFIWRRTSMQNEYVGSKTIRIDSVKNRYPANTPFPLVAPSQTKLEFNVYDVYLGIIGLLLKYENDDISVRLSSSVGMNYNYSPVNVSAGSGSGGITLVNSEYQRIKRPFYFGRLWITEPTTGLTLGGEVSNFLGKRTVKGVEIRNAQPNYNVTLSKAFNLKNLATVVKPLSSR